MTQSDVTGSTSPANSAPDRLGAINANLLGESKLAGDGEWIYKAEDSSDEGIIRKRRDGSGRSVVIKKSAKWLNLVGNWLYFIDNSSGGSIARVRTDGTGYQIIHESSVAEMIVRDNWIYFIDITKGRQLYKVRTDRSNLTRLASRKVTRLFLEGDWLYWSRFLDGFGKSAGIYRTRIDASVSATLSEQRIDQLTVGEGYVFYHAVDGVPGSRSILRQTTDGTHPERFLPYEAVTLIGVYDGWLYFYDGDQEKGLTRIRLNSADREVLMGPGDFGRVQFLDDQIIFFDNSRGMYRIMDLNGSDIMDFN